MARHRMARADYDSAIAFLRSALKQLEKDPSSTVDRTLCYIELARCYNLRGEHSTALAYAQWATNLLRNEWDVTLMRAEANLELGKALTNAAKPNEAHGYLISAYETFIAHNLWSKAAACMESIGMLARREGQIVRAINAFSLAKQLYRQAEDLDGVHRCDSYRRELTPKE